MDVIAWTPAEKRKARRLYRNFTSRAIAEIMGKPRAEVSELMRAMNTGGEPVPAGAELDTFTMAELRDFATLRENGANKDAAAANVIMTRRRHPRRQAAQ